MSGSLEDRIAGAFLKNDNQYNFKNKDKVWKQIEAMKHGSGLVPLFWKVAAIFIGILLAGSIWGSYSIWSHSQKRTSDLTSKNEFLQLTIDSLIMLPPSVKTEIQYVERGKVVYRDRIVKEGTSDQDERIVELKSQLERLEEKLKLLRVIFRQKEDSLKNAILNASKTNLIDNDALPLGEPAFVIKPAPVPNKLQKQIPVQSTGMRLKILHQPDFNKQFDSNTTFLKREP